MQVLEMTCKRLDCWVKSQAKKSLYLYRLFSIWLHDLDSNQGPND